MEAAGMSRRFAVLLALAVLVPVSLASIVSAGHERANGEEVCAKEAVDNIWPDNPLPEVVPCTDNELVAPGAHAEVTGLDVTTDTCTSDPVFCEVTIDVEAEHWAWQWNSTGELAVRVVGPTGQSVGHDECNTGDWQGECSTRVTLEHLAPIDELDTPTYEHEGWPPLEVLVNPQTFCVLAIAETTPWGVDGQHDDERDEDPARDLEGTCVDVGQQPFNAAP